MQSKSTHITAFRMVSSVIIAVGSLKSPQEKCPSFGAIASRAGSSTDTIGADLSILGLFFAGPNFTLANSSVGGFTFCFAFSFDGADFAFMSLTEPGSEIERARFSKI